MNINTSLRMAVVVLLGTAMQSAIAYSPTDPIKVASEQGTFSSESLAATTALAGFDIPVISGKSISSTAPYFVVITLKDGAKFGTGAATLKCNYASAVNVEAIADSPAAAVDGTIAAFKLQSAGTVQGGVAIGVLTASKCTLTLGMPAFKLTSGNKDYGVSVVSRHVDPSDSVSATVSGTLVTFTQGLQLSVSAGKVTVDVTSPALSKKFQVGGSVATVNAPKQLTASLGAIKYGFVPGVITLSGASISGNVVEAIKKYVASVTIVVSGAPLAAVQTTAATPVASTGGIFISNSAAVGAGNAAGGCEASAGGTTTTRQFASGTQVSFTVADTEIAAIDGVMNICMNADGVSAIDRGTVSFTITVAPDGSFKPNVGIVDTTLVKIVKNGTSLKVLNIPAPQNGTDQAYIRFYNMSSNTGKVFGTLYGQDGTMLGTPNVTLIDGFAKDNVKVLSSTDLATIFGMPTSATAQAWAGRAWLQIESEVKGLRVQALVRAGGAGGVLMNMSDRVLGDDETDTQRK